MTLEDSIRHLAEAGTVAALEEHLPRLLERFTMPGDPNERLTIDEAAAFLRMPAKTVRQRIREGAIVSFQDGIRSYVLRRDLVEYNAQLRAAAQFRRDQEALRAAPEGIDPDIAELLQPARPVSAAKRKAHRARR